MWGPPPLLGQIVRESEKWTWSLMPMDKVHDLKHQQATESVKKQILADDVLLLTNQSYHSTSISHPVTHLQTTKVYLNTMAVGGQQRVQPHLAEAAAEAAIEVVHAQYQDRDINGAGRGLRCSLLVVQAERGCWGVNSTSSAG